MNKNAILGVTGLVPVLESTAVSGGLVCTGSEKVIKSIGAEAFWASS